MAESSSEDEVTSPRSVAGKGPTDGAPAGGSQHHWPPASRTTRSSYSGSWSAGTDTASASSTSNKPPLVPQQPSQPTWQGAMRRAYAASS